MFTKVFASMVLVFIASFAWALEPKITVNVETPRTPVVTGTTNLPDGTELMLTISRKTSSYRAQDKVKVKGGRFQSARFSQNGVNLNPGKYSLEVLMPVPAVQADCVRSVIGEKGEKLKGPLVQEGRFGTTVRMISTFSVGSGSDEKLDKAARAQDKKDTEKWVRDSCKQNIETAQRLVREGKLRGREWTPEEKQKRIEDCIAEVNGGKTR